MELTALTRERQDRSRQIVVGGIALVALSYFAWKILGSPGAVPSGHPAVAVVHEPVHALPEPPRWYSILPFAALLLSIALLPLSHATAHWWERNWNRLFVAAGLGGITLLYYALAYGHGVVDHGTHALSSPGWPAALVVLKNAILFEYVPFMILLFSLYVISGGVSVEGHLVGRPRLNAGLIATGSVLASFVGTTGAAMLLVRPLLKANAQRRYVAHTVIFFVFVVCNTGGCLLPTGDPPLFLGFLRGVPFTWTLNLWPMWAFVNLVLVGVYFLWDLVRYRHEDRSQVELRPAAAPPVAIRGALNFAWLAGVIACAALLDPSQPVPGFEWHAPLYFREVTLLVITGLSLATTSSEIRAANAFSYDAILEVAALFVGIFICMQAPVQMLNTYGPRLGLDTPTEFYWCTGSLSSFLDNAPTYVVFFETAKTIPVSGPTVASVNADLLAAISLGAVFMGAMTYIGNGPNFMVKAIAEKQNVRMPSFFGYMLYSCAVLLPIYIAMNWLFLR
jgi:Na+/H+ antiporter NhaD/arsenite permease-like protein